MVKANGGPRTLMELSVLKTHWQAVGDTYYVNDLYATIQGEGVMTGVPMVLLRLHGCPVGCPFCDTKETWEVDPTQRALTLDEALGTNEKYAAASGIGIANRIESEFEDYLWVLLTGGEPARYDLEPLVTQLHRHGYKVALETSGTMIGHFGANVDHVCVSPKINMPGGLHVLPSVLASADEIKMVVGSQKHIDQLDTLLERVVLKSGATICLQPMSQSEKATELCIRTVQERGWRLSLQTHKYMNVR